MAQTVIRIPINNVKGGGDYTGEISVGSQGAIANVILDTGSSTLAVVPRVYKITDDNPNDNSSPPLYTRPDKCLGKGAESRFRTNRPPSRAKQGL